MGPAVPLGARAFFVLGMLARPMTAPELLALVRRALDEIPADLLEEMADAASDLAGYRGGSPSVTLRAVERSDIAGVEGLLAVLQSGGYADRVADMWYRVDPARWP